MSVVSYEVHGDIGVIRLHNPPVNALSQALREGLLGTVAAALADDTRVLLLICAGRTFVAGADITEFDGPPLEPSLPGVLDFIEASAKPVIAAIHGTALGGGLELALACHYRCALPSARFGLPEVKLGLLPGAGGTQRLPRLIGVESALDIIAGGEPVSAPDALALGLLDRLIEEEELETGALEFARELVQRGAGPKKLRDLEIDPAAVPADFFQAYRTRMEKYSRGQLAPRAIVDAMQAAVELPFDKGLRKERELFLACKKSDQSSALRHLFFAERRAARIENIETGGTPRPVESVAVIGGGTMGAGIAICFAAAGIPVTLLEVNEEALAAGMARLEKITAAAVARGKLSEGERARYLHNICGTTSYEALAPVDLVVEAVFENLELKQEIFSGLDRCCKPGCILASNTSYQDINHIAAACDRPGDVLGMHFFSPANVMKLLEVVRGDATSDEVLVTAMGLAKCIGKVPVLSGVCYGFIGNRMLRRYAGQAQLCLLEGASPDEVDGAMESWGMAMGPIAVADLAGLDIGYRARQALSDKEKGDPKTHAVADALVEQGRLGQKSSAGFYRYDGRARIPDPKVLSLIGEKAAKFGLARRRIGKDKIRERLLLVLVNEGARILEEGIAQRAGDIDVVYVNGYGFPRQRGGPMYWADHLGLRKVHSAICELYDRSGDDCWEPAPLLRELAGRESTFGQWSRDRQIL